MLSCWHTCKYFELYIFFRLLSAVILFKYKSVISTREPAGHRTTMFCGTTTTLTPMRSRCWRTSSVTPTYDVQEVRSNQFHFLSLTMDQFIFWLRPNTKTKIWDLINAKHKLMLEFCLKPRSSTKLSAKTELNPLDAKLFFAKLL